MSLDTAPLLYLMLTSDAGVADFVDARVQPLKRSVLSAAQSSIVYRVVTETDIPSVQLEDGLQQIRYQVDSYAPTYADARALANEVKRVLHKFRSAENGSVDGEFIELIICESGSRREAYEDDAQLYNVSREYTFFFN